MNAKEFFNAGGYFASLCERNKTARANGFRFCTCSGIESLQGPLDRFQTDSAFFCLDDTNDGQLFRGNSGGWFKRRTFTVFLLHRYEFDNEDDRAARLGLCRDLFRQVVSRLIVDGDDMKNELVFLHTETVLSRELGQYFMNGCTGLYFMIDVSEPVDLVYDPEEWRN